jgi:GMP synthase (glutamine-hydrolysing)
MSRVLVVQHVAFEGLGTIADALGDADVLAGYIRADQGQAIPTSMGDAAGLVVMGGPMGVYEQDRYPFLRDEIRLIEDALEREKPVLGICLGSQLLASALGAEVRKAKSKEIGWHQVWQSEGDLEDQLLSGIDSSFMAYHWHGDVFELPAGAGVLVSSETTRNQAFRYGGSAYGFLFHLEATGDIIRDMVKAGDDELQEIAADGDQILAETGNHLPRLQQIGRLVWKRWAALL